MSQRALWTVFGRHTWICRTCRASSTARTRLLSNSAKRDENLEFKAAPEIDLSERNDPPARIIPASSSYFTGSPVFNDHLLHLQTLVNRHQTIPTLPPDKIPRIAWLRLSQYRNTTGERIGAAKYAQLLILLARLNRIFPSLRPVEVNRIIKNFERPGSSMLKNAKPGTIDKYGRSQAVGRRKESTAKVYLVEGSGEVLVNGKSLVDVFPRVHDRESALWPLKISQRLDKYNVFALVRGGGVTGQAEAITLGLAKALLVHEPALKPALRRAGCVTRDPRRVERKKPGRRKARKMPQWVKR